MRTRSAFFLIVWLSTACSNSVVNPPGTNPDTLRPPANTPFIPAGPYVAGRSYFGRENYIEYVAGNAPVILTAPHGGALQPAEIPNRTANLCGGEATTVTDANTVDLVRAMQASFFARFGKYPHVIINHLARSKMDANRTEQEAACGDREATIALYEWHALIDSAKAAVLRTTGKGWYMDMHGHGHAIQRLELGYLLTAAQLNQSDAALNAGGTLEDLSSVRTLSRTSALSFAELIRSGNSLGELYRVAGFPSVPSQAEPSPGAEPYFSGGDNTRRHTCGSEASGLGGVTGGLICGVQIEANFTGVRDNAANRQRFADVTATVLEIYLSTHWAIQLRN